MPAGMVGDDKRVRSRERRKSQRENERRVRE